jgi:hypothetical protein
MAEQRFTSEEDCLKTGAMAKMSLLEGSQVPIRIQCIGVPSNLPANSPL